MKNDIVFTVDEEECMETNPCQHKITLNNPPYCVTKHMDGVSIAQLYVSSGREVPDHFKGYLDHLTPQVAPAPPHDTNKELFELLMSAMQDIGESKFGIVVRNGFKLCESEGLVTEKDRTDIQSDGLFFFLRKKNEGWSPPSDTDSVLVSNKKVKIEGHECRDVCCSDNDLVVIPKGTSFANLRELVELYEKWRLAGLIEGGSFLGVDVKYCGCT